MGLFNTLWANNSSGNAATSQVICTWNDGAGGAVDGSDATPVSGSSGSQPMPASAAAILSWRLAKRYRGGHPRTYLAGQVVGSMMNEVEWLSAFVTDKQTRANNFLTGVNALTPSPFTSVTLGVLSYFAAGGSETKPPTYLDPPVFRPFTSVIAKPGIATQRRRLGSNFN